MNKLDEDISEGFEKIKAFKKKVEENGFIKGKGNIKLFEEKGFEIPEAKRISRMLKEYVKFEPYNIWKLYGDNIVFRCNWWGKQTMVLFLGVYSDEEMSSSKYLSKSQKRNYNGEMKRNFVYLMNNRNNFVVVRTTTKTDSWTEFGATGLRNKVLGYRLTPENSFMNWNNPPI